MSADVAAGRLLAGLNPIRQPGTYMFSSAAADADIDTRDCVCVMREAEGLSLITAVSQVPAGAHASDYRAAWITLAVDSALEDMGLTAAVSRCLAEQLISCNIVAGVRHDHLFVPVADAQQSMLLLEALQREAREDLTRDNVGAATP